MAVNDILYSGQQYLRRVEGEVSTGYEQTTNKVTSVSSASTDTQYPTAKCLYDLVGDVETLLAAI